MKLCVVILCGAADEPHEQLGGKTPLAVADTPALAALAAAGRVGGVRTVPDGVAPSTEVAIASLLGVDPAGRRLPAGPLLARSLGVVPGAGETAWRCDLLNLFGGELVDPTAGELGGREAEILFASLADALGADGARFLPGRRWRGLLLLPGESGAVPATVSPATFVGDPTAGHLPKGRGAEVLSVLAERAEAVLMDHEVNTVRVDLGENPANGIWIWGGGRPADLPAGPVPEGGVAVGRHPSFLGLAASLGFSLHDIDDREGLAEVGRIAGKTVRDAELTLVCVEEPLVASRRGDVAAKIARLEEADRRILAPLADRLVEAGEGRLLVVASHVNSSATRRDRGGPVPFVLAGLDVARYGDAAFTEEQAAGADLVVTHGHELLEFAARS